MLVDVVDAEGDTHTVVWQGQDQINDFSGTLDAGAVANPVVPQQIAPANNERAGFLFQNNSANPMVLFEAGAVAGWLINSGAYFPPLPGYPIPTGVINVAGIFGTSVLGDSFTYREWQNAPDE
jgi:hypothetical protein